MAITVSFLPHINSENHTNTNGRYKGLGAGGGKPSSVIMADISNGVLYGVFVFSSFLASSLINVLGPRATVCIGVTGYPIYTGKVVPPPYIVNDLEL